MARAKDPALTVIKKIRRKLSARLTKAHEAGRLHDEMRAVHREAKRVRREVEARAKSRRRKQSQR